MKYVSVGRIISTHGLRGEVTFKYYNEDKRNMERYHQFFLFEGESVFPLKVESVRQKKDVFLLKFQGVETIEEAKRLVRKELFVREEDLPPLEDGEFYLYQLEGLSAYNERGELMGKVQGVLESRGVPILVILGEKETYVPFAEDFLLCVDVKEGFIRVREGLLEE